ncbi:hypothetical protein [Microcoleus sp. CAWBG27]|nr:hypothetical protein [Microcoleus sp. CAWBG27]
MFVFKTGIKQSINLPVNQSTRRAIEFTHNMKFLAKLLLCLTN